MKTKQIAFDAMLSAMCAVLGYVSLDMGTMKFTFESFPILLGSMLFGPVDGMIVAFAGTLIYQILKWGLMSTTILWLIPYVILAAFVGFLYKRCKNKTQYYFMMIASGIVITLLNTISIYIDAVVWDYYTFSYVFGAMPLRLLISIIKSIAFAIALPPIVSAIKKSAVI